MPGPIRLYNTLTRSVEPLRPLREDHVSIYTCGMTVYGDAHIGNWRTFIAEDILVKTLKYFGYTVSRVMNVTDVGHLTSDADDGEDKLQKGARKEGLTAWEIAKKYEERFLQEMQILHLAAPDQLIRATDTIPEQINLIKQLEEKGYTYLIEDGVYFDTSKFPDYGKMAHLKLSGQLEGARVEAKEEKKNPADFALWKLSPKDEKRDMEWKSPWGTGFPGWHIECSAIAMKTLGEQIDIHCGGVDHIPIHHTNEIAQTEAVTGKQFVQTWMHCNFLLLDDGKMSRSLGNLYTLAQLEEKGIHPLAFRYFTYTASYKAKLNFTWEAVQAAQNTWERLRNQVLALGEETEETDLTELEEALADDLNLPVVLAKLGELLKSNLSNPQKRWAALKIDKVLTLGLGETQEAEVIPEEVQELATKRDQARYEKDWLLADEIRIQIEKAGFTAKDTPTGTLLTRSKK